MKRAPISHRWINLVIVAMLFLSSSILQGCDGVMSSNDPESIIELSPEDKFRHAHLIDQMTRSVNASKNSNSVGLIIAIKPQKVLDRYKILDRYKVLDRYKILDRYEYEHSFTGFAIWVDAAEAHNLIAEMSKDSDIAWIEPDIYVGRMLIPLATETGDGSQLIPWGTQRIEAAGYNATGVDLFVIDTGVSHTDVNITEAVDFRENSHDAADYDGHGTHIAGIAAAIDDDKGLVGVAPGVNVRSLKVLNGNENSDGDQVEMATVIAAVEYVTEQKLANPNRPMVVNLSLGAYIGSKQYNALDEAIAASIANGVTYVVSAGNHGIDASTVTPAHVKDAITVGAYDLFDRFSPYSNHGKMVDILAPGSDIISLIPSTDESGYNYVKMSGTSMAAGYVSGAAALFLAQNQHASPTQVEKALVKSGKNVINNLPGKTTNITVSIPELLGIQLPPFFQYAIFADDDLELDGMRIFAERGVGYNANVFSNSWLKDSPDFIEGFCYYGSGHYSSWESVCKPKYNPTGVASLQTQQQIQKPVLKVEDFKHLATKHTSGDLTLGGRYESQIETIQLGTRENPVIWYVGDDLTLRHVRFEGYGVFLVKDDISISGTVSGGENSNESTIGLYAEDSINFTSYSSNGDIAAQIFANGDVGGYGAPTIRGSITVGNDVEFKRGADLYHRAASPALIEPFWPMNR